MSKILALLCSVVVVLFLSSCANSHDEEPHEIASYTVTSPLLADTTTVQEFVCQIHAIQHIELRALERGYLENIFVDEGQTVQKGQAMFQIKPVIYQAEYDQTKAETRVAEIEYLNTKTLAEKNIVSPNELAIAKAKLEQIQARLSLAKAHLDFTRIKAPFSGIMDRLHVRNGSLLEEGDMLAALSDNSEMWVYFNVSEAQYLNYRQGVSDNQQASVELKMANGAIFKHAGRVTTVAADFNNETGNIAFRATFPNPERLLRHGETGNILMKEKLKGAIMIPQKATFEVLDKKFVFVVGKDNVIHARLISIRAELTHLYVVESGIGKDDRILIDGLRKVKEGDKIEVKYVAPAEAMSSLGLHAE